jgi:hypothetical protein
MMRPKEKLNLALVFLFCAICITTASASDPSGFTNIPVGNFIDAVPVIPPSPSHEFSMTNIPLSPDFFLPLPSNSNIILDENDAPLYTNSDLSEPGNLFFEPFSITVKPVEEETQIDFSEPQYSISPKESALAFVRSEIIRYAEQGAPGAVGYPYEPDWSIVAVDPEPVLIYSIHGNPLYYDFSILQNGNHMAIIRVSALLTPDEGVRLIKILRSPNYVDLDESYKVALDLAGEKYPESQFVSAILVQYIHPRMGLPSLGYLVTLIDPSTGITQKLIVDAYFREVIEDAASGWSPRGYGFV